jgi:tryptophan synthase alpha chain
VKRIDAAFEKAKRSGEIALVCFVTAGDPDLATTKDVVKTLADAGADVIELGVPFSDPLADGPSIQASSFRALQNGATIPKVFETVAAIRRDCDVPLVLMTYYNPVQKYGIGRFASEAASAGADGVIVTDLPFEEAGEWKSAADGAKLATIQLIAPTSTKDRIELGAKMASGFIYCVSRTGVTGARNEVPVELGDLVKRIKAATDLPVAVGFGISTPEHVRSIAKFADGAVVGSAVVNLMQANAGKQDMLDRLRKFVMELKAACKP